MKKPKIRELREALRSLFSKPFTTDFPYKAHVPAKKFRGNPQYDEEKCVGCGACFQVCPADAIDMLDEKPENQQASRTMVHNPDRCLFCGECERNCITQEGIKLSQEFDVAYFKVQDVVTSVKHNLVICKECGETIGAEKHLAWAFKRIGSLGFAQPVMISRIMDELEIHTGAEEKIVPPIQRTDMLKIVCPKCRRIAFISDEQKER